MLAYLQWQFFTAPVWLITLALNLERALLQYFSVPVMLRTLVSHWHKDAVGYRGSISSRLLALAWNLISRAIGFIIRTSVLIIWLVAAILLLVGSAIFIMSCIIAPFAIVAGFIWSLTLAFL